MRLTNIALAHLSKIAKGVQSGIVSIAPDKPQGIVTDWFDVFEHHEQGHVFIFEFERSRPFIGAGGTGAMES